MNLPTHIQFAGGQNITYRYDAAGIKLQKTVDDGTRQVTTDYMSGYQYEDGKLLFFPTPEGYVKAIYKPGDNTAPALYQYIYIYKDHLGNNRLSYTLDPESERVKILEENHYYPFGLKHNAYVPIRKDVKYQEQLVEKKEIKQIAPEEGKYKYKYNGKEWQDELGLNTYAYGWREYDPAIARFNRIDRFAEKYFNLTPYSYAGNNPVLFIDVQGDFIAEGSQKEFNRNKKRIRKTRDRLQRRINKINLKAQKKGWTKEKLANRIGNKKLRVSSLNKTLEDLTKLETSSQVYELKSGQIEGGLTYDSSSGNIIIGYGSTANFVHEVTHARQFETGDIAFYTTTGKSILQDLSDEVEAYKAQFAFSPSSVSELNGTTKASSFADITGTWVQGIKDARGNRLYAPGGSANTGIVPININSTREDLIRAYPNNPTIRNLPANFNLQAQPTIYFKKQ